MVNVSRTPGAFASIDLGPTLGGGDPFPELSPDVRVHLGPDAPREPHVLDTTICIYFLRGDFP